MNKLLSFIAIACLCGATLAGCVDDSQNVILKGLVPGEETCNATGDNTMYAGLVTPMFDCDLWQCTDVTLVKAWVNVVNNNATDTVWSSSGGSSSGSTLDFDIPNTNMIYVDEVIVECVDVDGDSSKCDGVDKSRYTLNVPVTAGGGMCHQVIFDFSPFVALLGNTVNVSIRTHYHDTGKIKGYSSNIILPIINAECSEQVGALSCELKSDGDPCVAAAQCQGNICEANDTGRMVCKSPDKDEESGTSTSSGKKPSGERCGGDSECESGSCIETLSPDGMTAYWICA